MSAQAGLSWDTILAKGENYRKAFDGFDARRISRYTAREKRALMNDAGIVRNRLKIEAAVVNARCFLALISDALSRDLKGRGFKFVGSTIMYAFMQATGMVDDHLLACFCRRKARS